MSKNLYIDASHPNETRVVLKSENNIEDYEYENLNNNLIKNSEDFELIGENSSLDSLAIVNFLTIIENQVFKNINIKKDIVNKIFNDKKEKLYIKDLFLILEK